MDQTTSQLTNEELNCFMDKWENEALVQMADQAEERDQSQELNSFMDMWEKEEKEALDVERGQFDLQLQPTQEQKVRKFSI